MQQMISYGNELIRINLAKNRIEYSTDSGRTWHPRCSNTSSGTFLGLLDGGKELLAQTSKGLYYSTNKGNVWHKRS